jgi:hypothetical protein
MDGALYMTPQKHLIKVPSSDLPQLRTNKPQKKCYRPKTGLLSIKEKHG